MGIPHATVVQMINDGIQSVYDLVNFDTKSLKLPRPSPHQPSPLGPGLGNDQQWHVTLSDIMTPLAMM